DLADQVDHFGALGVAEFGLHLLQGAQGGVERFGHRLQLGQGLLAAFLVAARQAFGVAGRLAVGAALLEAGVVAVALALAIAVGHRALPVFGSGRRGDRIAAAIGHDLRERREVIRPELLHSAVASANSWTSISPPSASSLTCAMI